MNKKKFTKLLALYLPYLVIGLAATNFGEEYSCILAATPILIVFII